MPAAPRALSLTPHGHPILAPSDDAPAPADAVQRRVEPAFERSAGSGLLNLGLREVGQKVAAQVMGSRLYRVHVNISEVPVSQWSNIARDCAQSIDSLAELLHGQLSTSVMERIARPGTGLIPAPLEITFSCSCPDSAAMCKHVAATLYGVGVRLDSEPALLFSLRNIDANELITRVGESTLAGRKGPSAGRILDSARLADVFGIDVANLGGKDVSGGGASGYQE